MLSACPFLVMDRALPVPVADALVKKVRDETVVHWVDFCASFGADPAMAVCQKGSDFFVCAPDGHDAGKLVVQDAVFVCSQVNDGVLRRSEFKLTCIILILHYFDFRRVSRATPFELVMHQAPRAAKHA
jgi:hypothetical protein